MSFGQLSIQEEPAPVKGTAHDQMRGRRLALWSVALWAVLAALSLVPGALVLSLHEGDAIHLAAMALRVSEGQWPHLDFMTPIGILAVAPIGGLISLGLGLGQSFVWAQLLVAAAILPAAVWAARTRFASEVLALAFVGLVLGVAMAFTHGGTTPSISISMHYNRWAWAISFVIMALILLPRHRGAAPRMEGVILGLAMAVLVLTKVTYAVALAPPVLLALILRRDVPTLLAALAAGALGIGAMTVIGGLSFWGAYVNDLLAVATSSSRSAPGLSLADVLVAPANLAGTLVGLGAVMVLRRAGHETEAIVLLALLPGLVLITWQNFGNEAQWLPVVGLVLIALATGSERQGQLVLASMAFALSAGWMTNMAASGIRMAAADPQESGAVFPDLAGHDDFRLGQGRLDTVEMVSPYSTFADPPQTRTWGAPLPECDLRAGGVRVFQAIAEELDAAGFAGTPLLVADTFQSFWLFGDFPPLHRGAPWYYDGLPGAGAAEAIVVPLCPINDKARDRLLDAVDTAGWIVSENYRGTHVAVLRIVDR